MPLLRYAVRISDVTWIAMTKLDILSGLEKIKICVEYDVDGKTVKIAPPEVRFLERAKPIYMEINGWGKMSEESWRKVSERGWEALPDEAKAYVETVEKLIRKPIRLVSIGADVGLEVTK